MAYWLVADAGVLWCFGIAYARIWHPKCVHDNSWLSRGSWMEVGGKLEYLGPMLKSFIPMAVVDGGWGSWSTWGPCTVTCGSGGTYNRTRSCNNPQPAHGGEVCSGSTWETEDCSPIIPCPGDSFAKTISYHCQQVSAGKTSVKTLSYTSIKASSHKLHSFCLWMKDLKLCTSRKKWDTWWQNVLFLKTSFHHPVFMNVIINFSSWW